MEPHMTRVPQLASVTLLKKGVLKETPLFPLQEGGNKQNNRLGL
jgi:hypothetical protein